VRREPVSNPPGGARRTLCALEQPAQNGVRREPVPNPPGGARRTLCAPEDTRKMERNALFTLYLIGDAQ
jgi:hypothetical protein